MVHAVCGILIDGKTVLIGKRKSDNRSYPSKWEFPGGKLNPGESAWNACKREWKEELDIEVNPMHQLRTLANSDIEFTPFILQLVSGKAKMLDHDELRFVGKVEFFKMDLTKLSKDVGKMFFGSYDVFLKK